MEINLISEKEFNILSGIQKKYPILTFNNKGYEYIDKSKFTDKDKKAFRIVVNILRKSIIGFSKFNNFRVIKNEIQIRVQYHWDISFTGVGYVMLNELLNGFEEEDVNINIVSELGKKINSPFW